MSSWTPSIVPGGGQPGASAACDMMLEGLVSKRRDSRYRASPTRLDQGQEPKSPAINRAKDALFPFVSTERLDASDPQVNDRMGAKVRKRPRHHVWAVPCGNAAKIVLACGPLGS
jgi:hypothetical protein